jgi:hypothetical protein
VQFADSVGKLLPGALIQTNTSSFATFRIFYNFLWICFQGKELFIAQVNENTHVTLFERVVVSAPKGINSFLQNAKENQLPPVKSKKIPLKLKCIVCGALLPLAVC